MSLSIYAHLFTVTLCVLLYKNSCKWSSVWTNCSCWKSETSLEEMTCTYLPVIVHLSHSWISSAEDPLWLDLPCTSKPATLPNTNRRPHLIISLAHSYTHTHLPTSPPSGEWAGQPMSSLPWRTLFTAGCLHRRWWRAISLSVFLPSVCGVSTEWWGGSSMLD